MWTGGLPTKAGYLTYLGSPRAMSTGPKGARYIQNGPSYYNSQTRNKEGLKNVPFRHSCFLRASFVIHQLIANNHDAWYK